MAQNYRNKIGIYYDILRSLKEHQDVNVSQMVLYCNVSHYQLLPRLKELCDNELIKESKASQKTRYGQMSIYNILDKGISLMWDMEKINQAMHNLGGAFTN